MAPPPVSQHFYAIFFFLFLLEASFGNTVARAQLSSRFAPTPSGIPLSGVTPHALAESDVNDDGKLDLVVAAFASSNATSPTISYLPGDGKGSFGKPVFMVTLPSSYSILTSGDFNHDGRLDLILFQPTTGRILPMLQTAQHGFSTGTSFLCSACGLGNTLAGQATGDFNRDGNLDVVFANMTSATLVTLLGKGNGTFGSPVVSHGFATAQQTIVAGDFNRDGLLDLVVGDGGDVFQTALGNGDGSFRAGSAFQSSLGLTTTLLSADLTGDGKLDLVAVSSGSADIDGCAQGATLYILPGNGDGTFGAAKEYPTGYLPDDAVIADFNGDGKPDIVTLNPYGNSFSVLLNLGSGKLAPAVSYKVDVASFFFSGQVFGGDLNGDKRADLTIAVDNRVTTITAQPGGTFHVALAAEFFTFPDTLMPPIDLNRDGIPDLLAVGSDETCRGDSVAGDLTPLISSNGIPLNKIGQGVILEDFSFIASGIGDFNSDGNLDAVLVPTDITSNNIGVYLNDGHGNFAPAGDPNSFLSTSATNLAVGDFNGDGKSDLALIDGGNIQIRLGTGGKNFSAPVSYSAAGHPVSIAVRDLNGDGKKDLVAVNQGNDSISILLGRGNGTFNAAKSYPVANGPFQVAFADFNRDGKVDMVVADADEVSVLLGKGDGTFLSSHNYAAGTPLASLATATLRGNGDADVLVGAKSGDLIWFPGAGNGTLGAAQHYAARGADLLQVGDFNGDGAPDVVVSGPLGSAMSLLYNQGGTRISIATSATSITAGHPVTFTANLRASVPNSGTPAGAIAFRDGTKTLATVTVANGKATFTTASLAKGTHSIAASYNGNASFNSHTSTPITVNVK
jgi:Bacterial Ig-like domain (group 3)/FG-GAP-like repeat